MNDSPPISVIICTRDRPEAFQRALESVLAQDIGGYEVVVVDGSEPPVVCGRSRRIPLRVVHGERGGEGRARRAGLRLAQGALIAWCDDDDEWTTDHLRRLRDELLAHPDAALVYAAPEPAPAGAHPARSAAPFGFAIEAGDVLHRAAVVTRSGGFDPRLRSGAGGDLWARIVAIGGYRRVNARLTQHHHLPAVATDSERGQAQRRLRREWQGEAARRTETGRWLAARRESPAPFDPATWQENGRELIFQTILEAGVSFSIVAWELIQALTALDVRVCASARARDRVPAHWRTFVQSIEPQNRLAFIFEPPVDGTPLRCEHVVRYAMWETSIVPPSQVEQINATLAMLYVPCRESARIARHNGVAVPVRVLHHGIDPRRFPLLERVRGSDDPFVFGCHSALQHRKGTDLLIRAFREEFAPHEPARLILKHTWDHCHDYAATDPRITILTGLIDHQRLLDYLAGLDAYVLPSRGEGFGLTGLEAMATGLPLIATDWSGPAEYLDPADSYPLRYELRETDGISFGFRRQWGYWAEPDIGHLRELMRFVYEHREEASAAGRPASVRAHRDWTWERIGRQIIDDFDLLGGGMSPASTPL